MKNETKLLNCPICDGEVIIEKFYESCDGRGDKFPKVKCCKCDLIMDFALNDLIKVDEKFNYKGGYRSQHKGLVDEMYQILIDRWNTRKPMERIIERLEEKAEKEMANSEKAAELGRAYEKHMILYGAKGMAFEDAIEIIREEGGIE